MDLTGLVAAANFVNLLGTLALLSVVMVAPGIARWGYNKIIGWFSDDSDELTFEEEAEMDDDELQDLYEFHDEPEPLEDDD